MNDQIGASESARPARRPRSPDRRVFWGIVLILVGCALFGVGLDALIHPEGVVTNSSDTARSPDTDADAMIGGLVLCFFGLVVLLFGVGLLKGKPPKDTSPAS